MYSFLLYGIPNIIGAVLGAIFLAVFIPKYRKKETIKEKVKPLIVMYTVLICAEVLKIYFHVSMIGTFSPTTFPIIYCSFVMYTLPLICHAKPGSKAFRIACGVTIVSCLAIGFPYFFVYPSVASAPNFYVYAMHYHSRIYHILMLASAIYLVVINVYDFRFKDSILCILSVSLYLVFCSVLSMIVNRDISIFGPDSEYFQIIYTRFGYGVGNLMLCAVLVFGGLLIYGVIDIIKKQVIKKRS